MGIINQRPDPKAREQRDERALPLAKKAYDAASANPYIADTYGWILVTQGKVQEGLEILEVASNAAPELEDIRKHIEEAKAKL